MKNFKSLLLLIILTLSIVGLVSCNSSDSFPNPKLTEVTDQKEVVRLQSELEQNILDEDPSFAVREELYLNMEYEGFLKSDLELMFNSIEIESKTSYKKGIETDYSDLYFRSDSQIKYESNNKEYNLIENYHIVENMYYKEQQNTKTTGVVAVKKLSPVSNESLTEDYEQRVEDVFDVIKEIVFNEQNITNLKEYLKVYEYEDGYVYKFEISDYIYLGNEIAEVGSHINLKFELFIENNKLFAMELSYEYGLDSILDVDYKESIKIYSSSEAPFKKASYKNYENGRGITIYVD